MGGFAGEPRPTTFWGIGRTRKGTTDRGGPRQRGRWLRAAPKIAPALLLLAMIAAQAGDAFGGPLRPLGQPLGVTYAEAPRISQRADGAVLMQIDLSQEVDHATFVLAAREGRTDRIVLDLSEVRWRPAGGARGFAPGVRGVRYALFEPGRSRVVVDLDRPAKVLSSRVAPPSGGAPARIELVFEMAPTFAPAEAITTATTRGPIAAAPAPAAPVAAPLGATRAGAPRLTARADGAILLQMPVSAPVPFAPFIVKAQGDRPHRVVLDMPEMIWGPGDAAIIDSADVLGVRRAKFAAGRSRMVVDLARPAKILSSRVAPADALSPARIELLFALEPAPWARPSPAPSAWTPTNFGAIETSTVRATPVGGDFEAARLGSAPLTARRPSPRPRFRQSGDVPVILLDPGHGGRDPGAIYGGLMEKDLTLSFAQELRRRLHRQGVVHVYLTRTDDTYITLEERVQKAISMNAALFVSIHADALPSNPGVSGASVYTLAQKASDEIAAELAAGHGGGDGGGGHGAPAEGDWRTAQLAGTIGRKVGHDSRIMADLFVEEFRRSGLDLLRTRPHRSAGFVVLKNFDTPSVLIELGFLTSAEDRRRFGTPQWRAAAVDAVARSVMRWVTKDYDPAFLARVQ